MKRAISSPAFVLRAAAKASRCLADHVLVPSLSGRLFFDHGDVPVVSGLRQGEEHT